MDKIYTVPRWVHFVFTGGEFGYLYYLGVVSALQTHVVQGINLWCFEEPQGRYWDLVKKRVYLRILEKPDFPAILGMVDCDKASTLSNYLRWKVLYEQGGLYLDLDTISLKDAFELHDGEFQLAVGLVVEDIDGPLLAFNSAVIMASPGSELIKLAYDTTSAWLNYDSIEHGRTGPHLLTDIIRKNRQLVQILPFGTWDGWGKVDLVGRLFEEDTELWSDAGILHLYAKNFHSKVSQINEDMIASSNWLLAKVIRETLPLDTYRPGQDITYDHHSEPLFDYLRNNKCRNILEVGTYRGNNAIKMIRASAANESDITYYGFDLFESMQSDAAAREGIRFCADADDIHVVRDHITDNTVAKVNLYKGNTLLANVAGLDLPVMDLIYIDGGHSVSTIANDWGKFSQLMDEDTIVFFDDYIDDNEVIGCMSLINALADNDLYDVVVYPQADMYSGGRNTHMASVQYRSLGVHFLTTGQKFPYVYYLTVMTALKVYGDRVVLWCIQQPNSPYFDVLTDRVDIRYIEDVIDFPVLRGVDEHKRDVGIFDYYIWQIISEYGGMLMGLDTIILKDHFDLLGDKEVAIGIDHEEREDSLAMGGMVVRRGSKIAKLIAQDSYNTLNSDDYAFAKAGAIPASTRCKEFPDKVNFVPFGLISGFWHNNTGHYVFHEDGELLHPDTRMISLYGTTTKYIIDKIDPEYVKSSKTLYARLVRDRLTPEEYDPLGELGRSSISGASYVKPTPPVNVRPKRFHLLGLAHLPTNKERAGACAFSMKVLKMAQMLKNLGHEVIFYGVEGSTVECDEFVEVSTQRILDDTYGRYDHTKEQYKHDPKDFAHSYFNARCVTEINRRKKPKDFLLIPMGNYQKPVVNGVQPLRFAVESGIGYSGIFAEFKVFETYAWMHHVYGLMNKTLGSYYDAVIPNYFDPIDFTFSDDKQDYFLFMGRLIQNKGIIIAKRTVEALGAKLLIAGQPGENIDLSGPNVEYIGFADWEKRRELMKNAKALFVPTVYVEPFGGVSIEAAFSGTPVITTDWGCFAENVVHGKTGYRCRTLDQFVWAADNISRIKPSDCYQWAMDNFTIERVGLMYEEYFNMLTDIDGLGWDTVHDDRVEMDWLSRKYPG